MTPAEASLLAVGDPVRLEVIIARGSGQQSENGFAIARVTARFDGHRLPVRWPSGLHEFVGVNQLAAVSAAAEPILGLPRDVVAFAAGIHAAGTRNWHVIAVTLQTVGLGARDPAHLASAVDIWTREVTRRADVSDDAMAAALARVKPGTIH